MALSGSVKTSTFDGRGMQLTWTATQNVSKNQSTISWTLKPFGGTYAWYSTGSLTVKIDGKTVYNYTGDRISMYLTWSTSGTVTLDHASDGSKSFSVSVAASIYNWEVNCTGSGTFTLDKIARTPTAPTSLTIPATVSIGDTITLTWSGATGVITGYQMQYAKGYTSNPSNWTDWRKPTVTSGSGSTTDTYSNTDASVNGSGMTVKYRIRAMNGSLASAWRESNTMQILGAMDVNAGGTWKNGSTWINVNGTWKRAKCVWINVNGTWKQSK